MEIFSFKGLLRERIARVGIEARRDADNRWLEVTHLLQGSRENFPILETRQARRDREIETIIPNIRRACPRIARMLMNGVKGRVRMILQNRFRTIPMMDIEIVDSNSMAACGQRLQSGDSD